MQQQQSYAAAVAAKAATGQGAAGAAGSIGSSNARASPNPVFCHLSDLLLAGPDLQAISVCPLVYPRLAALLLAGLECFVLQGAAANNDSSSGGPLGSLLNTAAAAGAAAAPAGSVSAAAGAGPGLTIDSAKEQLAALHQGWMVPCVLQPLVGTPRTNAWGAMLSQQQQHQQQMQGDEEGHQVVQQAYWRTVLLLYAAAVHQLGLRAVRAALPDWHSVEVSG
jgi:hypothetical protein